MLAVLLCNVRNEILGAVMAAQNEDTTKEQAGADTTNPEEAETSVKSEGIYHFLMDTAQEAKNVALTKIAIQLDGLDAAKVIEDAIDAVVEGKSIEEALVASQANKPSEPVSIAPSEPEPEPDPKPENEKSWSERFTSFVSEAKETTRSYLELDKITLDKQAQQIRELNYEQSKKLLVEAAYHAKCLADPNVSKDEKVKHNAILMQRIGEITRRKSKMFPANSTLLLARALSPIILNEDKQDLEATSDELKEYLDKSSLLEMAFRNFVHDKAYKLGKTAMKVDVLLDAAQLAVMPDAQQLADLSVDEDDYKLNLQKRIAQGLQEAKSAFDNSVVSGLKGLQDQVAGGTKEEASLLKKAESELGKRGKELIEELLNVDSLSSDHAVKIRKELGEIAVTNVNKTKIIGMAIDLYKKQRSMVNETADKVGLMNRINEVENQVLDLKTQMVKFVQKEREQLQDPQQLTTTDIRKPFNQLLNSTQPIMPAIEQFKKDILPMVNNNETFVNALAETATAMLRLQRTNNTRIAQFEGRTEVLAQDIPVAPVSDTRRTLTPGIDAQTQKTPTKRDTGPTPREDVAPERPKNR